MHSKYVAVVPYARQFEIWPAITARYLGIKHCGHESAMKSSMEKDAILAMQQTTNHQQLLSKTILLQTSSISASHVHASNCDG